MTITMTAPPPRRMPPPSGKAAAAAAALLDVVARSHVAPTHGLLLALARSADSTSLARWPSLSPGTRRSAWCRCARAPPGAPAPSPCCRRGYTPRRCTRARPCAWGRAAAPRCNGGTRGRTSSGCGTRSPAGSARRRWWARPSTTLDEEHHRLVPVLRLDRVDAELEVGIADGLRDGGVGEGRQREAEVREGRRVLRMQGPLKA